jgi:hypothetical protein
MRFRLARFSGPAKCVRHARKEKAIRTKLINDAWKNVLDACRNAQFYCGIKIRGDLLFVSECPLTTYVFAGTEAWTENIGFTRGQEKG